MSVTNRINHEIEHKQMGVRPFISVSVSDFATGGLGTSASPFTGWDTVITWTANVDYQFEAKVYSCVKSPAGWKQNQINLSGLKNASIIRFTGTGVGLDLNLIGSSSVQRLNFNGLVFEGTANTTITAEIGNVHRSSFDNLRFRNATQSNLHLKFCVLNSWKNLRIAELTSSPQSPMPNNGLILDYDGVTTDNYTTTQDFYSVMIENITGGIGVEIRHRASNINFYGGTIESNSVGYYSPDSGVNSPTKNLCSGLDMEANTGGDVILIGGTGCSFMSCMMLSPATNAYLNKTFVVDTSANQITVIGGFIASGYDHSSIGGVTLIGVQTDLVADWSMYGNGFTVLGDTTTNGNRLPTNSKLGNGGTAIYKAVGAETRTLSFLGTITATIPTVNSLDHYLAGLKIGDVVSVTPKSSVSASNIVGSGTSVTATVASHNYRVGDCVSLSGDGITAYNGTFELTAQTATSLTWASTATGTSSGAPILSLANYSYTAEVVAVNSFRIKCKQEFGSIYQNPPAITVSVFNVRQSA